MELRVAARELDWGGAMLCLLRCPAGEDDIDGGGVVLIKLIFDKTTVFNYNFKL